MSSKEINNNIKIAVLTSGGDCCGMNAALRAIVGTAMESGATIYGVKYGYSGLLKNRIKRLNWKWVNRLGTEGGTALHTARCAKFMTKKGQRRAARNLIRLGIDNLIVIGGDGTLRGALELKKRYRKLYGKMLERGELKEGQRDLHALSIVGIPGTIDSDIYGTDVTLGADTALHRIVEVASRLNSTMRSHRRIYILETMGNKCGWLGLMAGVALDADYIFIPEVRKEWREELMRSVSIAVKHHKADILVVVSEGAVEIDGKPITMVEVAKELAEFEPRTLCIGHIQRGGCPSARDAMLGTLSGITATRHLIDSRYDTFSEVTNNRDKMVALCNGKIALIDLKRVVSENKWTESIIKKGESAFTRRTEMFKKVFERYEWHRKSKLSIFGYMDLEKNSEDSGIRPEIEKTSSSVDRDKKENCSFIESHRSISTIPLIRQIGDLENMTLDDSETRKIKSSNSTKVASEASSASKILRICVLNNGEITAGMNGCLNMLVQIGLSIGHKMFYFLNGDRNMQVLKEASLFQFRKDSCASGSVIGASNSTLSTSRIKEQIRAHSLDWLIVVGEMKNINILGDLDKAILIPTESIEDNEEGVPSTKLWDMCLGFDSRLNGIMRAANICKTAAYACEQVVYLMEVPSRRHCVGGALVCGAFDVFCGIFESQGRDPDEEVKRIKEKIGSYFKRHRKAGMVIIRSLDVLQNISTDSLAKMLSEGTNFRVRHCVPGPLCNGDSVSPYDQITSSMAAAEAMKAITEGATSGVVGAISGRVSFLILENFFELAFNCKSLEELKGLLGYCRLLGDWKDK